VGLRTAAAVNYSALLGWVLALLAVTVPAWSDEAFLKVRMAGESHGADGAARVAAVRDAESKIVAETLKAILSTDDVGSFANLLAHCEEYIRSTQLIEYKTVDGRTHVEVESLVKRTDLMREAARVLLASRAAPPSVLLLMVERAGGDPGSVSDKGSTAVDALADILRKAGLAIADTGVVTQCHSKQALADIITGEPDKAHILARQGFADVIVLGEVVCSGDVPSSGGNVVANKATVTLRLFRGTDGRLTDAFSQEAVVRSVDISEGTRAATEDACAKLARELSTAAVLATAGEKRPQGLVFTVETPETRARFDEFLERLRSLIGEGNVDELFYTDALARVRAEYDGPLPDLLEGLTDQPYSGTKLDVTRAVGHDVILRFES